MSDDLSLSIFVYLFYPSSKILCLDSSFVSSAKKRTLNSLHFTGATIIGILIIYSASIDKVWKMEKDDEKE